LLHQDLWSFFKLLVYKAALTTDSCSQSGLDGGQAIPKAALRAVLPCHVYLAKYTSLKKKGDLFTKVVIVRNDLATIWGVMLNFRPKNVQDT